MPQSTPDVHIEILEPRDQTQIYANHVVLLRASALAGSDDLGADIRWRSDRDGFLGQGGEITVQLTEGKHQLRAAVRRRSAKPGRSSREGSQTRRDDEADSEDSAKDSVEVNAVPVDYPGGDT
ncbi:MAG: hypothetical protein AAGC60_02435 [Acidobacteriota bacterium]